MTELKEKTNFLTIVIAVILILIGQVAAIYHANNIILISFVISILYTALCNKKEIILLLMLTIAPNRLLTYGSMSVPSLIMIVGVLRGISTNYNLNKKIVSFAVLLVLYSSFLIFMESNQFFSSIKIVIMIIFYDMYTKNDALKIMYEKIVKYCSLGCIISAFFSFLFNPSFLKEASRFGLTESGENVLGILCAILILNFICLNLDSNHKHKKYNFINIVILLVIGLFTGSRSFLLILAVGGLFILFYLLSKLKLNQILKLLLIVFIVGITFFMLYETNSYINQYFTNLLHRMDKLQNTDISNGRYELWKEYIKVFKEKPYYLWFGNLNYIKYGLEFVAHNMIIEQLAAYGIVGSIIITALYTTFFKKIKKENFCKPFFSERYAPLVAFFAGEMVSHSIVGITQTTLLYICVLSIYTGTKQKGGK